MVVAIGAVESGGQRVSRVIGLGGVYRRHHSTALRGFEMRQAILRNADSLFPGLLVVGTEILKLYHNEEITVDLALVDLPGERWWVGRVLPRVSDLDLEVLMPTLGLRRTTYLSTDVDEISAGVEQANADQVRAIVEAQVPGVVTFVSNPSPGWYDRVTAGEGHLAVLETFSSISGETLLRLNGDLPRADGSRIGPCKPVPHTSGIYKLEGLGARWGHDQTQFDFDGEMVSATATVAGPDVLLDLEGVVDVAADRDLVLWQIAADQFEFRLEETGHD